MDAAREAGGPLGRSLRRARRSAGGRR